jgi:hypothetical protein
MPSPRQKPPLSTAEVRRRSGQAPTVDRFTLLSPDDLLTALIVRAYPEGQGRCCMAQPFGHGYACTLDELHDGPHVAYASDGPVAVWPQEDR